MSVAEASKIPASAENVSVGTGEEIPLSATQAFLVAYDKGPDQGSLGPRHLVVAAWRLSGEIDVGTLRQALDDVVARHDVLRTSVVRGEEGACQKVSAAAASPELTVRDLDGEFSSRELRAEEFINEIESGTLGVDDIPHLRAALGRFDETDSVLVLVTHHIASDGWSMHLLVRDLVAFYRARRSHTPPDLPQLAQYAEHAIWQQARQADHADQRAYWREKLRDARMLAVPTDHPLSPAVGVYSVYRFVFDEDLSAATLAFARRMRSSPFMILFAAFSMLLSRTTGVTDVVIPTVTSGRSEPKFHDTVGVFFNFVPLRIELTGADTFSKVVERTRASCLEAYSREIPFLEIFGEAPSLAEPWPGEDRAVFAFQVFQFPSSQEETAGEPEYEEVRMRRLSDPATSDIPDGVLWTLDLVPSGHMVGSLRFNSNLFDMETFAEMVSTYQHLLRESLAAPDSPLAQLCSRSEEPSR